MNTQPREMQNRLLLRKRSNRRKRRTFLQKTALHTDLRIFVKCEAKIGQFLESSSSSPERQWSDVIWPVIILKITSRNAPILVNPSPDMLVIFLLKSKNRCQNTFPSTVRLYLLHFHTSLSEVRLLQYLFSSVWVLNVLTFLKNSIQFQKYTLKSMH